MGQQLLLLLCLLFAAQSLRAAPPYTGTVELDPDIITAADPSTFTGISYIGRGMRWMFDRRLGTFALFNAYLFDAQFADGPSVEVQVNPEFGSSANAQTQAMVFLPAIGRIPRALRQDLRTIWLHQGNHDFGGGNNNLLIHSGSVAQHYIANGFLEEVFVHEATHTSLDAAHAGASGWLAAQASDPEFISTYARDHPMREDVAESFLVWLAVRFRAARISEFMESTVTRTIPHRLAYFDAQGFTIAPVTGSASLYADGFE